MDKAQMRKQFIASRQQIADRADQEMHVVENLYRFIEEGSFETIYSYCAFRGELDLSSLHHRLLEGGYQLALPRMSSDGAMDFFLWNGRPLNVNKYGIEEPDSNDPLVTPDCSSLILVPCLAIDCTGSRLGYGGGYYDRYLQKFCSTSTISPVFESQIVTAVAREDHDISVQWICHAQEIKKTRSS